MHFQCSVTLNVSTLICTVRKRSLGQGDVFTHVSQSVILFTGWEVCIPHRILRDTVNERAVHILLEYILAAMCIRTSREGSVFSRVCVHNESPFPGHLCGQISEQKDEKYLSRLSNSGQTLPKVYNSDTVSIARQMD